jgi:hypothetical protein
VTIRDAVCAALPQRQHHAIDDQTGAAAQ